MRLLTIVFALSIVLIGCNSKPASESKPATPQAAPAKAADQLLTGRSALQKMAIPAHIWAADIQPIGLESQPRESSDGSDGKSAVWRSVWGSESKRSAKNFSWSGAAADDPNSRGITPGGEDSWSPTNTSMQAFNFGFLKVDSDAALTTAKEKVKGKPTTPVRYSLAFDRKKDQLVWRVTFGPGEHGRTIDVDASTGKYVRTER